MPWNAGVYLTFSAQRSRPAMELLGRIFFSAAPDFIVDLGCGPGNSTDILHQRWPDTRILGVDNSEEMLQRARRDRIPAEFELADIATWRPKQQPSIIFSNAALQWLDNHQTLLPQLISYLPQGGVLAVQMPRNFDAPSHVLLREVATNGPWASYTKNAIRYDPVATPEVYYDLLAPITSSVDIWETVCCFCCCT